MSGRQDVTGLVAGKLTAVSYSHFEKRQSVWLCRCECGGTRLVGLGRLRANDVYSCGCERRPFKITHGHSWHPQFRTWTKMIDRCHKEKSPDYYLYGMRGISVCERWRGSFELFLADMGPRPSKSHSLDRIDNDGNYEPSNVRWATPKQQRRNSRRIISVEIDGRTQCLKDWAIELGKKYCTVKLRIAKGMSPKDALLLPSQQGRGKKPRHGKTTKTVTTRAEAQKHVACDGD